MNFAELVIEGLSDAGFRIVKTNPKMSIEELKAKGLSQKDTEVLQAFVASIKTFEPKPETRIKSVKTTNNPRPQPKKQERVLVFNRRTGMTVAMKPRAGNRILNKLNPNRAGAMPKNLGVAQPDIRTYEAR